MTNRVALFLALFLGAAIVLDLLLNQGQIFVFLAQKFLHLVDWVQFWR
ncbi:hypothetical protein [Pseudogemmobacter humi]|uniref:Glyceraldehyde-3-phosphate dehydrogenase n=1 Tax=Pseudogemmobacter humi TaxID=2483812 RepID=A0A3P5XPZ7_9RHOB|nr:hypothetical protein [Pseudogemmobacter humi]VDC30859.1 hypothetical protein XINFAN_02758 [Pseudogemmobacter humi]